MLSLLTVISEKAKILKKQKRSKKIIHLNVFFWLVMITSNLF
jgi:hypothetical protein